MTTEGEELEVLPEGSITVGRFPHLASTSTKEKAGANVWIFAVPARFRNGDTAYRQPAFLLRPSGGRSFNSGEVKSAFEKWKEARNMRAFRAPRLQKLIRFPKSPELLKLASLSDRLAPWRNTVRARDALSADVERDCNAPPSTKESADPVRSAWVVRPWLFLFDEHHVTLYDDSTPVADLDAIDAAWAVARASVVSGTPWPPGKGRVPSHVISDDVLLLEAVVETARCQLKDAADFVLAVGAASWGDIEPEKTRMPEGGFYWSKVAAALRAGDPIDDYRQQLLRRASKAKSHAARSCFEPALLPDRRANWTFTEDQLAPAANTETWLLNWLREDSVARILYALAGREASALDLHMCEFAVSETDDVDPSTVMTTRVHARRDFESFLEIRKRPFVRARLSLRPDHPVRGKLSYLFRGFGKNGGAVAGRFRGYVTEDLLHLLRHHHDLKDGSVKIKWIVFPQGDRLE